MPADRAAEVTPAATTEPLHQLLDRPAAERCREYRYRFGQSIVFGLPVIALGLFGPVVGGPESGRWIGLLQLLLGGWVIYIGALALLIDAILRRRVTADALVAALSLLLYLLGAAGVIYLFVTARSHQQRWAFAVEVAVLCAWNGAQWLRHRRHGETRA
jgi:cation transport ATPase